MKKTITTLFVAILALNLFAETNASSVPEQCTDVMLQAFYWDSNSATAFGNTQWITLDAQFSEMGQYFDLVWLPPSAKSSGGVGYIPIQWNDQNSAWGSEKKLRQLINNLHSTGCKVIADVVINHRGGESNWCNFPEDDFGSYGNFQLTNQHICSGDEMWSSSSSDAVCKTGTRGGSDTGENYEAARDLDHSSVTVQNDVKAYMQWLKNEIGYDGWRYDMVKGFSGSFVNQYNQAANNYFSVGEFYDYSYDACYNWILSTNSNSLVFDFPAKFGGGSAGINTAFKNNDLTKLIWQADGKPQPAGLIHHSQSKKYAVTFIDNHDTYGRGESSKEFYAVNATNKAKILQANAYILCSPGVPCIFYPHWCSYKNELKPMIEARKATGVHSQSEVTVNASSNTLYAATVIGKYGQLAVKVGSSDWSPSGDGWTLATYGTNYAIWTKIINVQAPRLGISPVGGIYVGGTSVTMTATNGGTIYYTTDGSEPTASSQKYTTAIAITTNTELKAIAVNSGGKSVTHTHAYQTSQPETDPITVKFEKPATWSTVNIWAWNAANPTNVWNSSVKWPGVTMTTEGDGWWSYTFDKSIKEVNMIFNNGVSSNTIQTGDILDVTQSTCFKFNGAKKQPIISNDCGLSALPKVIVLRLHIFPNPVENELQIANYEKNESAIQILDLTGKTVFTQNFFSEKINVSVLPKGMYTVCITDKNGEIVIGRFIKIK